MPIEKNFRRARTPNPNHGIVRNTNQHAVDDTVTTLERILQAKGMKLFELVDHSAEAERMGLMMRPTKLLIFGNPKAVTPLMVASPSGAIDLPLKILVWKDADTDVWVSYNTPASVKARHNSPQELIQNIAVVNALAVEPASDFSGRSRLALCEGSTPIRVLNARRVFAAAGAGEAGDLAAAEAITSMLSWPSWPASMITREADIWEESFEAR